MPSHIWTHTLNRGSSPNPRQTETITADAEEVRELTIPAATTNQQVIIAFTTGALKSIMIKADGACTVKTNSTSVPDDTFSLDADTAVLWNNAMSAANPITANVTTIYITTPAGDPVEVDIYALVDSTP